MRRAGIALGVFAFLSGCAQLAGLVSGRSEIVVEPAASEVMLISVPRLGAQGYAVPIASSGSVVTWQTVDQASFAFDQGVIVSTRGLGDDLMGADGSQSIAALNGKAGDWAPRINAYMNGEYQSYFMTFQCRRTGSRSIEIPIGDRRVFVTEISESCVNNERQIENTYWRNSNGSVLKSRQWVSPTVGYMETERVIR